MKTMFDTMPATAVRELVEATEPTAAVYLAPRDPTGDIEPRLRRIGRMLARHGADEQTTDLTLHAAARHAAAGGGAAVLARAGTLCLARTLPDVVRTDRVRFGTPAHVLPLLAWSQRHPPYLVVVVDHLGAELTTVPGSGAPPTTIGIVGPDDDIECNAPGGLSQPRYQRRAVDSWQHNAAAVADAVTGQLRRVPARLVLLGGDVRAVHLLRAHLTPQIRREVTLRRVPGGRSPDGSAQARTAAIAAAVADFVAERDRLLLADLAERRPDATVHGIAGTLAALAEGQVATLVVEDRPDDERRAWFSRDTLCSTKPVRGAAHGPLIDVAVRAAVRTHADIHVLDAGVSDLPDGIGGSVRYPAG
jgi:hypothetical protein